MIITMDVSEQFSDSNDHSITKRKRTKRPRPVAASTPSTNFSPFLYDCSVAKLHNSFSSPSSTSTGLSTTTEEDDQEIAASCLMLLAGGDSLEIKKVDIYVYECKTCSKSFPSFQALGGHRASHKKPKIITPAQLPKRTGHNQNTAAHITRECSICGSRFGSGQALGGHMRRHKSGISSSKNNNLKSGISVDAYENAQNMLSLDLNMPASPEYDQSEAVVVDCNY